MNLFLHMWRKYKNLPILLFFPAVPLSISFFFSALFLFSFFAKKILNIYPFYHVHFKETNISVAGDTSWQSRATVKLLPCVPPATPWTSPPSIRTGPRHTIKWRYGVTNVYTELNIWLNIMNTQCRIYCSRRIHFCQNISE